jgi:hypothetical protein
MAPFLMVFCVLDTRPSGLVQGRMDSEESLTTYVRWALQGTG